MRIRFVNGFGSAWKIMRNNRRGFVESRWFMNQEENKENEQEAQVEQGSEEDSMTALKEEFELLKEQLSQKDRHLKEVIADAENTRRIAKNDVAVAQEYGIQKMAKNLLEVSDNLDMTLKVMESVKVDTLFDELLGLEFVQQNKELSRKVTTLKGVVDGIAITNKLMDKVLHKEGIARIPDPTGEPFDPSVHEALFNHPVEDEDKHDTIAEVYKHGYKMKDRLLRPVQAAVHTPKIEE